MRKDDKNVSNRRTSNNRRAPSLYLIASIVLIVVLVVSFGIVAAYSALEIHRHTEQAASAELTAEAGRLAAHLGAVFASVRNMVDISAAVPGVDTPPRAGEHPAFPVMIGGVQTNPYTRSVAIAYDDGALFSVGRVADAPIPDSWTVPEGAELFVESASNADGQQITEVRFFDGRLNLLSIVDSGGPGPPPSDTSWNDVAAPSARLFDRLALPGVLGSGPAFARRIEQGVLLAAIDARRLEETVELSAENRSLVLVDSEGAVLVELGGRREVARVAGERLVGGEPSRGSEAPISVNDTRFLVGARPVSGAEDGQPAAHVVLVEEWPPFYEHRSLIVATAVGGGVLVVAIAVGLLLIGRLSRVLRDLTRMAGSIGRLVLDGSPRYSPRARELSDLNAHMDSMRAALGAVTRYLPRTLVQQFIEGSLEPELGGTWRDISVMFTAIQDFTSFAERENAGIVFLQLSEYFRIVGRAIRAQEGIIDKYMGDAIMALWNASKDTERHSRKAVITALSIRNLMVTINELWEENGQPRFESRIGINSGSALVGNIGSDERLDFTAMGSTVNLAARLEPMNKYFDTDILVSKDVLEAAGPGFVTRQIGIVRPRGSEQNVEIFEVVGAGWEAPECPVMVGPEEQQKASAWSSILKLFYDREWNKTMTFIDDFLTEYPGDRVAIVYRDLAAKYARKEPGKGWHGVLSLR
jgi:adenylate cyclase